MPKVKTIINERKIFEVILLKYGKTLRQPQLNLSLEISNAYDNKHKFVAEAEVGTGKSYAYLVPAINIIKEEKKPFLISTGTIVLQEQLINKDIPELSNILLEEDYLKKPLASHIGKGKEHYICEKKLINYSSKVAEDPNKSIILNEIVKQYEKGFFDRSNFKDVSESIWKNIKVNYCNSNQCEHRECLYRKLKQERLIYDYDFLVCNHHYLLSLLKDRQFSLNNFSGIVIDEAHNLEGAAFAIFGDNKGEKDFLNCLSKIKDRLAKSSDYRYKGQELDNAFKLAKKIFQAIHENTQITDLDFNARHKVVISDEIKKIAEELLYEMNELLYAIHSIDMGSRKQEERLDHELEELGDFLEQVNESVENVYWVQLEGNKPCLYYIPCNIDEILYDLLFSKDLPVVLTSGTMSSSEGEEGFDYFINSLGIDMCKQSNYQKPVSIKSPFDFSSQAGLYIEKDVEFKNIKSPGQEKYLKSKAERIYEIIKSTRGKALVLFTSYVSMDKTYKYISDRLTNELNISCFKQGMGSNIQLLEQFSRQESSCLFATGSFWEGIDIKGPSLSCVIIDKLPFPVKDDPVIDYKIEKKGVNDGEVLIPEMILRLKQGAGRLIRDENDKGVLVIMDSRASTSYYDIMVEALPDYKILESMKEIKDILN